MKKSIIELAMELLKTNKYAGIGYGSTIKVEDEHGNRYVFLFSYSGYNEYCGYSFSCHSDLYESPIAFSLTTVTENFNLKSMKYDSEIVSKHEKTLRRAIELALPLEPVKQRRSEEKESLVSLIRQIGNLAQLARNQGFLILEDEYKKIDDELLSLGVQMISDAVEPDIVKKTLEEKAAASHKIGVELLRQAIIIEGVRLLQNGEPVPSLKGKLLRYLGDDMDV